MTTDVSYIVTANVSSVNTSWPPLRATSSPAVGLKSSVGSFKLDPIIITIGVVGLLGNLVVIVTIVSHSKMLKQVTNVLIVNQSCNDLLAALLLVLVYAAPTRSRLNRELLTDVLYCRLWHSRLFLWALMLASTGSLLLITIERYIAVLYPIYHKTQVSKRRVLVAMASNWFVSIGYYFASMIPSTDIVDRKCQPLAVWPTETVAQAVSVTMISVQYFLPVLTMAFCYSRMAYVISHKVAPGGQTTTTTTAATTTAGQATGQYDTIKLNILKAMITVCCMFVGCWTLNEILLLLYVVGVPINLSSWFYNLSVVLVFCSCAVNPFIYVARYREFQHAFQRLVGKVIVAVGGLVPTKAKIIKTSVTKSSL